MTDKQWKEVVEINDLHYRSAADKDNWKEAFNTAMNALLDCDMPADSAKRAVRLAAELADIALECIEERWCEQ